tara:strand:- start:49 stop:267 length:219 start_codon:yes stop_codon:yes gene_type:complete
LNKGNGMRLKLVSQGLRSENTKVIDENGEMINGISSVSININTDGVGEVTLVIHDMEVYADFDREQIKVKLV